MEYLDTARSGVAFIAYGGFLWLLIRWFDRDAAAFMFKYLAGVGVLITAFAMLYAVLTFIFTIGR